MELTTLVRVGMIDGDRWISERLAFLRGALNGDLSEDQRQAIEAEIATLRTERGIHHGGPRLLRLPRRLTAWGRARANRRDPGERPARDDRAPERGQGEAGCS